MERETGKSLAAELAIDHISLFRDFDRNEIGEIACRCQRRTYQVGELIFREGEIGDEMFVIVKGTASAYLEENDSGNIRLATFAPGTIFRELALLDRGQRSATLVADSELVCHVLGRQGFTSLCEQAPAIAIKLITSISAELSGRLRRANRAIHQLSY